MIIEKWTKKIKEIPLGMIHAKGMDSHKTFILF